MVEAAGQFSVRGDIVDIWYQPTTPPTRVEFFAIRGVKQAHVNTSRGAFGHNILRKRKE